MKVLVNGIGNIGTTLLGVLTTYREELGITEILALKNNPMPWHTADLKKLTEQGVTVCTHNATEGFASLNEHLSSIDYIFDATNNGGGMNNLEWYKKLPNLLGASAQGSEKNFGTSFMSGVNNEVLRASKYAHIVSCNTHAIAAILRTFCGSSLDLLQEADFVIVRRSEDLGNHQRLVSANVVARHLNDQLGTHHAIDVLDLYKTINVSFKVSSSDVTTPSQLMHGVRFNIRLKEGIPQEKLNEHIAKNPLVSYTHKFDSNVIFERGRRYGLHGRIYSHAVIVSNNILTVDNQLMGWAFIPQEGNTILSTVHAYLLQTQHAHSDRVMELLSNELIEKEW